MCDTSPDVIRNPSVTTMAAKRDFAVAAAAATPMMYAGARTVGPFWGHSHVEANSSSYNAPLPPGNAMAANVTATLAAA